MQSAVSAAIVGNRSQDVFRTNLLPFLDDSAGKVAIDGDIAAVTDKDISGATKLEDARHNTIEDGSSTGSGPAHIVRSLIVELDILHAWHVVESEATAQHVLAGDRNRQTSLVLFEGTIELAVFCREPSDRFCCFTLRKQAVLGLNMQKYQT